MKNKITLSILLALASIIFITSCKKDETPGDDYHSEPTEKTATLDFHFDMVAGSANEDLELGKKYITTEGDSVWLDYVRYWIGGIEFIREDNSVWTENANYRLIELTQSKNKHGFQLQVPEGKYKSVRFVVGVKPNHNASLDSVVGELNPTIGMSWNWNTGYIFMKNEGQYYNTNSMDWEPFKYHLGMNENLQTVELPFAQVTELGANKDFEFNVRYHSLKIFTSPNVMDLSTNPTLMVGPADQTARASENYGKAFELVSVEAK